MSNIVHNPGQKKAIAFLSAWWTSTLPFAILHGAAGTGKTTIIKDIVSILYNAVPLYTAPTNEACRQLKLALPEGSLVLTTYSALGYAMDTSSESKKFVKMVDAEAVKQVNLIIVDESSMIPKVLLDDLISLGKQGKKILFVGHRSQLPPVDTALTALRDAESPVFEQDWPLVSLTKSERSSGELLTYINYLETLIEARHKIYKKERWKKSKDDLYEYFHTKEGRREFKEDRAKVICFTNKEVDAWNKLIRESLHRGKDLDRFLPNDRILLTEPVTYIGEADGFSRKAILKAVSDTATIETNTRLQIKSVSTSKLLVSCWKIVTVEGYYLYVPMDGVEFKNLRTSLLNEAFSCVTPKARRAAFSRFHNIMSLYANIKHSYAFTTHRSQGMTIDEVWVNWEDIKKCNNVMLRHKLLYVAASRAKHKMWIVE